MPDALVPFKAMNDCYPKAVVHVQPGNSRYVPKRLVPDSIYKASYFIPLRAASSNPLSLRNIALNIKHPVLELRG